MNGCRLQTNPVHSLLKELISIPGQGNSRPGNSRDARKTLVANVIVVLFRAPAPNPPESSGGAAGS